MQKDITIIGAAIIDIFAGPVSEKVFKAGSMAMQETHMSFGGDALNESVALSRMGKQVELISKVGNDEAGRRVLDYIKENNICTDKITVEDLKKILCYVDYIFPNQEEIALLTGETDPYINARLLVEAGVSCAVVKCGTKGCIIQTKDILYEIPTYPVEHVVDTTGAGDCFAAGFIYALSEGMSLPECGRLACAVASCTIESVGATDGIKSIDEPWKRFQSL